MGRQRAEEMASLLPRRQALEDHLLHNHYPPISLDFLETAEAALDLAAQEKWDRLVTMPNSIRKSVREIIDGMHLEPFLEEANG